MDVLGSSSVGNKYDSAASHERLANEFESPVAGNRATISKKTKDNTYEQIPDSHRTTPEELKK
jgi:hypothetical protein